MILDLTKPMGKKPDDIPAAQAGEDLQTHLSDHPDDPTKLVVSQVQDLEPYTADNYQARQEALRTGRDFKRGGTMRRIGSIPLVEQARDKELAEAIMTRDADNGVAIKRWLRKHPQYTTVKPGSF